MVLSLAATCICLFFFNDTATTEIYTLSLHDALPICLSARGGARRRSRFSRTDPGAARGRLPAPRAPGAAAAGRARTARPDRKSTRLNSSHANISYAVFCLKKKKKKTTTSATVYHIVL